MRKKTVAVGGTATLALVLAACGNGDSSGDDGEFYSNSDPIELVVPHGEGGGTDLQARFIAMNMSENITGNPTVQVINVTGGGGMLGTLEFQERRQPDGFSYLFAASSTTIPYALGDPAVQYDLAELNALMGVPLGGVIYVSPDTGVQVPADLADLEERIIYSGIEPGGTDLLSLVAFEVLGVDVHPLLGFDGFGAARVAFEQGESNASFATTTGAVGWEHMEESGEAIPLFAFGRAMDGELHPDVGFPELPTVEDVYVELYGEAPSGDVWEAYLAINEVALTNNKVLWAHPDTPQEATDALLAGIQQMIDDGLFSTSEAVEFFGEIEPIVGEEAATSVANMLEPDPAAVEWLRNYLVTELEQERYAQ